MVAVADPDPLRRDRLAERHGVPSGHRFAGALELLSAPRIADLAILATPDEAHVQPAISALTRDDHVLLEKPIATASASGPTRREVAVSRRRRSHHGGREAARRHG